MKITVRNVTSKQLQQAETLITTAINMGVRSWHVIAALFASTDMDDQTIADLKPKWDVLYDDVKRAAEGR